MANWSSKLVQTGKTGQSLVLSSSSFVTGETSLHSSLSCAHLLSAFLHCWGLPVGKTLLQMKCEIPTEPECPFKAAACEAGEEGML